MHFPRKRFGQHFLCDTSVIEHIVHALAPETNQHLVEIGPGQGALTLPVLKQASTLEAIELDRDLIAELERRCKQAGKLTVYAADALTFDFASVKRDSRLLRIFGNLPYNISTPLIFHLLAYAPFIADMVFMLQKEVALRIAAGAGEEDYGRLSVMVQYHCAVEWLFDVPPEAFYPPPQVQSSIIKLTPYRECPHVATNYNFFSALVKQAFGQRRKTLRNSLKGIVSNAVWEQTAIRADRRPETLSVKEFVELSNQAQAMEG